MTKPKPGTQQQLAKKGLRRCVNCGKIKSLFGFYRKWHNKGYYFSKCKVCCRAETNKKYGEDPEPKKIYQRQFYQENREYYDAYEKQHRGIRRIRQKARGFPLDNICSECGRSREELEALGLRFERHHDEYDKPDDFVSVCSECHGKGRRIDEARLQTYAGYDGHGAGSTGSRQGRRVET